MSVERITLDSNILVYALDRAAGERHKHAQTIMADAVHRDCVLTLQALCEFFSVVTRKGKLPETEARAQVRDWQLLFPIVSAVPATLDRAVQAVMRHHLAFWDAMLWATAREARATVLYSEDFQHDRILDNVRFVNPFAVER